MGFRYLSNCRALKAQASLRRCAELPEPWLLPYTKYGIICRLREVYYNLPNLEEVYYNLHNSAEVYYNLPNSVEVYYNLPNSVEV